MAVRRSTRSTSTCRVTRRPSSSTSEPGCRRKRLSSAPPVAPDGPGGIMSEEVPARNSPSAPARPTIDLGPLPGLSGYALRRAQLAVYHDFHTVVEGHDIRPVQFGVLLVLAANPGMKQSDVGAALGIKRSNFVALIDGLEQRGL